MTGVTVAPGMPKDWRKMAMSSKNPGEVSSTGIHTATLDETVPATFRAFDDVARTLISVERDAAGSLSSCDGGILGSELVGEEESE